MIGSYHAIVQNSSVKYEFDIKRNITVIKGDSATGKTVLVDMIREFVLNGDDSGISLSCSIPCRVIEGNTWEEQLSSIVGSIVFIDEGNRFVSSNDFARIVKEGKNYYVIVTRERLANLPYSVEEIYGIHSSGKYESLVPVYHEMYRIYDSQSIGEHLTSDIYPDEIIVEDSNSGFEFFDYVSENRIRCVSASGRDNIFTILNSTAFTEELLIVADGAAFGSEMERIYEIVRKNANMHLYLPESFEWLILKSGVVKDSWLVDLLEITEKYVDSEKYFSWERFFTATIIELTKETFLAYQKERLNENYKQKKISELILQSMSGIKIKGSEE